MGINTPAKRTRRTDPAGCHMQLLIPHNSRPESDDVHGRSKLGVLLLTGVDVCDTGAFTTRPKNVPSRRGGRPIGADCAGGAVQALTLGTKPVSLEMQARCGRRQQWPAVVKTSSLTAYFQRTYWYHHRRRPFRLIGNVTSRGLAWAGANGGIEYRERLVALRNFVRLSFCTVWHSVYAHAAGSSSANDVLRATLTILPKFRAHLHIHAAHCYPTERLVWLSSVA